MLFFNVTKLETNSATIYWDLPQRRFSGFKFSIESINKNELCFVSDSLSDYIHSGVKAKEKLCKEENHSASFKFESLEPGTEYRISVKTFKLTVYSTVTYSEDSFINVLTGKNCVLSLFFN